MLVLAPQSKPMNLSILDLHFGINKALDGRGRVHVQQPSPKSQRVDKSCILAMKISLAFSSVRIVPKSEFHKLIGLCQKKVNCNRVCSTIIEGEDAALGSQNCVGDHSMISTVSV